MMLGLHGLWGHGVKGGEVVHIEGLGLRPSLEPNRASTVLATSGWLMVMPTELPKIEIEDT